MKTETTGGILMRKRRIAAALAALMLVCALGGCGGDAPDEGVPTQATTQTARTLSDWECDEIEALLREVSHYGFLGVNVYSSPEEIDPLCVFYDGAGLARTPAPEWDLREQQAILGDKWEKNTFVVPYRYDREAAEAFFVQKTGISLSELSKKPREEFPYSDKDEAFLFSREWDAYYVVHGDGAYFYQVQVSGGEADEDGRYAVHYTSGSPGAVAYTVTLQKTETGYRFLSNQPANAEGNDEQTEAEAAQQKERLAALEAANRALQTQLEETKKEYTYPYLPAGLTGEKIRADLERHTELIPFEAALGGKNYFSHIHILSARHVYATAGDDHRYENLLLQYTVKDGVIEWTLLGRYDW